MDEQLEVIIHGGVEECITFRIFHLHVETTLHKAISGVERDVTVKKETRLSSTIVDHPV